MLPRPKATILAMIPSDPETPPRNDDPAPRSASFLQVLGAVLWGFLGIRKRASGERDMVTIKPLHVIIAAVLAAAALVAALVTLVTIITRKG
jgi:hypothetical protein